jgi:transposase
MDAVGICVPLSRYTLDGRYRIDNNLVENSVRPVAVGRKGYLFCGNYDTTEDAAVYYSFMGCCKLADIDPKKCMNYFLAHTLDYDTDYSLDLTELLPAHLKAKELLA